MENSIYTLQKQLCGNTINPRVLVIGCMHGDEPQGKYLIQKYVEKFPNSELLFIPCLNAYGVEKNKRTNNNGVDLNRNYPTQNWLLSEKDNYYGGESPASEIETKFVIDIVNKFNPQIILTLHAPYKVVNYDCTEKNKNYTKSLAERISGIIGYPVEESIGYPTPGSFGTWAGIEHGIPTITLELDEECLVESLEKPVFDIFKLLERING